MNNLFVASFTVLQYFHRFDIITVLQLEILFVDFIYIYIYICIYKRVWNHTLYTEANIKCVQDQL